MTTLAVQIPIVKCLAFLLEITLLVLLVWIGIFLMNLAHEGGHILMYRILFRDKHWQITIGTGKTILKLKRFILKIIPIRGFYNTKAGQRGTKLQSILMYLGGPVANMLSLIMLAILSNVIKANELNQQPGFNWFLGFLFWANVYQFIITIIPVQYSFWPYVGEPSDGMRILMKIKEADKQDVSR